MIVLSVLLLLLLLELLLLRIIIMVNSCYGTAAVRLPSIG